MPFTTPTFTEAAESEIIDSILAVVHRDQKLALDYFYPADALPDFAVMTQGEDTLFDYPFFVAWLGEMDSVEGDGELRLDQDLKIAAGIAVKDSAVAAAKKKATKYVRAFKAVIRSASVADLFPAANLMFEHTIDIKHVYLKHTSNEGGEVVQTVRFGLRFKFGEK